MRATSIETYNDLLHSGQIGQLQWEVLRDLLEHGQATGREIATRSGIDGAWKRCSELERKGLVESAEVRPCSISGRNAIVWKPVTEKTDPTPGVLFQ